MGEGGGGTTVLRGFRGLVVRWWMVQDNLNIFLTLSGACAKINHILSL